jgi:hypothetical protein
MEMFLFVRLQNQQDNARAHRDPGMCRTIDRFPNFSITDELLLDEMSLGE